MKALRTVASVFLIMLFAVSVIPFHALGYADENNYNFSTKMIQTVRHRGRARDAYWYNQYYLDLDHNIVVYVDSRRYYDYHVHGYELYMLKTNDDGYFSFIDYSGDSPNIYLKKEGLLFKRLVAYEKVNDEYQKMPDWKEERVGKPPIRDLEEIDFFENHKKPEVIQKKFEAKGLLD